jgi:hypothetical protein
MSQRGKSATMGGKLGLLSLYTLSREVVYFQSVQTHKTNPQHHNTITPQHQAQHLAQKKLSLFFSAFAFLFTFLTFST